MGSEMCIRDSCSPAIVTLTNTEPEDLTIDFGFQPPPQAAIGDWVWFDANSNGLQDTGETGFAGIGIILREQNGAVLATTSTRSDGSYDFLGLCAGTYTVEVDLSTVPAPKVLTFCNVGPDRTIDSNCSPTIVVLPTSTSVDNSVDFGLREQT